MTTPTEAPREALPEPLKVVAWWIEPLGLAHRDKPHPSYKAEPVVRLTDAQSALESERQAHAAEVERLRADAERLDFLDSLNRALNTQYGTTYQWKLVLSPNVVRLMAGRHDKGYVGDVDLHDSDAHGAASCRAAIDQAIARGKT